MVNSTAVIRKAEKIVYFILHVSPSDALLVRADINAWLVALDSENASYKPNGQIGFAGQLALSALKLFIQRPFYTSFGMLSLLASPLTLIYALVV